MICMWCDKWEAHEYGGALVIERDVKIIGACASHDESMQSNYLPLMYQLPHFCLLSGVTGRLFQVCSIVHKYYQDSLLY